MKRRLPAFLAGMLATALLFALTVTTLAVSGTVEFNTVGVVFHGAQLSKAGQSYALPNGVQAPSVITYTDEKGGGTTYLPARRLAELLGVDIGWDAASGSVTIGSEAAPAAISPTPAPTPAPTPTPTPTPQATVTVYVTKTGGKYHRDGCRYLSKSQISIALSAAKSQGYSPCSVCNPPA